jgi:hypothetical protein
VTGGLFWFAQVNNGSKYPSLLLPAMLVMATGMAMVFVTLTVVAVTKVTDTDTGLASALLNVGQQVGGSIGLAVLTTRFASASRSEGSSQLSKLTGPSKAHLQDLLHPGGHGPKPESLHDSVAVNAYHSVLSHGSSQGFLTAAIFGIVAILAGLILINVKKSDMPQGGLPIGG